MRGIYFCMVFVHVCLFFDSIGKVEGTCFLNVFEANVLTIIGKLKLSFLPDKTSPRRLPRKRAQKRSVGSDE